jgi:hypothetical protein
MLLAGCARYRPNAQTNPLEVIQHAPEYDLGIVELDDQGWFYDRGDAARVLDLVKREADANGAVIAVFVHGWHHSAERNDSNLTDFKKVLVDIHNVLQKEIFVESRKKIIPGAKNRVVGVYVGWRGASLPPFLDYATFFDRRDAAVRVGTGDVPELFSRLQEVYTTHNGPREGGGWDFTTLVTMGHSFGAQVVFSAVADRFKTSIADKIGVDQSGAGAPIGEVKGFGDLVVLVNPAHEASIYDSIHRLTRHQRYQRTQLPILLTVSSEGDWPNRDAFPFGRTLGTRHEPKGPGDQRSQKIRTLGHHTPHITHCLTLTSGPPCKGFTAKPAPPQVPSIQPSLLFAIPPELIEMAKDRSVGATSFYGVGDPIDLNNPFLVAKATTPVVADHNDMFNSHLIEFLVNYVARAELKRVLRVYKAQNQAK